MHVSGVFGKNEREGGSYVQSSFLCAIVQLVPQKSLFV